MARIKLVGCGFHKTKKETIENDMVKLIREPENRFDKEAIAVYNSFDEKIGYVGTAKTVSIGNRKNGCIDNHQLGNMIGNQTTGIITKFKEYFGFIEVKI